MTLVESFSLVISRAGRDIHERNADAIYQDLHARSKVSVKRERMKDGTRSDGGKRRGEENAVSETYEDNRPKQIPDIHQVRVRS